MPKHVWKLSRACLMIISQKPSFVDLIAQTFIWPLLSKTTRVDRLFPTPMRGVGSRGLYIAEHDQKPKAWPRHWRTKGTKPVSIMGEWIPLIGVWLRNALTKKRA